MTHLATFLAGITLVTSLFAQGAKPQVKPKPQVAKGAAALQGTWAVSSVNGEEPTPGNELTLTFEGNKYHQTYGGKVNERGTFTVDAAKKPMTDRARASSPRAISAVAVGMTTMPIPRIRLVNGSKILFPMS